MRLARISAVAVLTAAVALAPAVALGQGRGHGPKPTRAHGRPTATAPKTQGAPRTRGNPHTTSSRPARPHSTTVGQQINTKPMLAARLTGLLPPGMSLETAAAGFRNQGQFIAALHVSRNLSIPFTALKANMVDRHLSLGQSIQALRPSADVTAAVRRAQADADEDLRAARKPKPAVRTREDRRRRGRQ